MILDHELDGGKLAEIIQDGMEHPERLREMAKKSFQMGRRGATENVRRVCMDLMRRAY